MSLILQIASTRSVAVQQYADALSPATVPTAQARLEHCTADLDASFHFNGLCLNPSKSAAILLGTCQHLLSFPTVPSVNVASCPVTDQITTLSVIADKHFTFDSHVSSLCQKLRHICSFLREDVAASVASTKCFYCIALYCVVCFKTEWWGVGVVICLERGADLHMAQLKPLPLTVSCFSKIQVHACVRAAYSFDSSVGS